MPRKTKDEAEKTRTRILASALDLFARQGYEHTTFTHIAARLKMTKGAVYWHFASKEALLIALVDEMLDKFERQIDALKPKGELTFLEVADMMVKNAAATVRDAHGSAFFMLMESQIRWTDATMAKVREDLLANDKFGPIHAFRTALENDVRAGRAREGVASDQVANACVAMWHGLVRARIDGFLGSDLEATLNGAYRAVWDSLKRTENR